LGIGGGVVGVQGRP